MWSIRPAASCSRQSHLTRTSRCRHCAGGVLACRPLSVRCGRSRATGVTLLPPSNGQPATSLWRTRDVTQAVVPRVVFSYNSTTSPDHCRDALRGRSAGFGLPMRSASNRRDASCTSRLQRRHRVGISIDATTASCSGRTPVGTGKRPWTSRSSLRSLRLRANYFDNTINEYSIDPTTGVLVLVLRSGIPTGAGPTSGRYRSQSSKAQPRHVSAVRALARDSYHSLRGGFC